MKDKEEKREGPLCISKGGVFETDEVMKIGKNANADIYNHTSSSIPLPSFQNTPTAILPFYINILFIPPIGSERIDDHIANRVFHVFRIFRLLKIARFSEGAVLFYHTLRASLPALKFFAYLTSGRSKCG